MYAAWTTDVLNWAVVFYAKCECSKGSFLPIFEKLDAIIFKSHLLLVT